MSQAPVPGTFLDALPILPITALALALFCIPATLLFHAFWSVDAASFGNKLNHFLKNVAIFGALLVIASLANRGHAASGATTGAATASTRR